MFLQDLESSSVRKILSWCLPLLGLMFAAADVTAADTGAFDLIGPSVEVKVIKNGKPLPIAEVSNLQAGDRVWIHPDFPESQSAPYLLVVAFLRGSTNPPPDSWFTRAETWNKKVREEGITVTVPQEAQQVLIFLAPDTGGGFGTLRKAVRSLPGVFVRASQDLNQAALYRSRLDKYLDEVRETSDTDPNELRERSVQMARTLKIKVDQQCFDRPPDQQASCLTQNRDRLLLDDGHSQSVVAALTTGPSSDLIGAITATPMAGGGFYSAYVGAVMDLARLLGNIHTAEYQYIPAMAMPKGVGLNLHLNNPPSFRNPKSVIVVTLPAVEAPQLPPLRAVSADQVFCLQNPSLVLSVDGAPLVFSTDLAHDLVLSLQTKTGASLDLPAKPDATRGGFVIDTRKVQGAQLEPQLVGTIRGLWGFEPFDGPSFQFQTAHSTTWNIPPAEADSLIVGRDDVLHLQSSCAVCTEEVTIRTQGGIERKAIWKLNGINELEIQVSMKEEKTGRVRVLVKQFGVPLADELNFNAYSEAARLEQFTISAGDVEGVLEGSRLDQVDGLELNGVHFTPGNLARANHKDLLYLSANDPGQAATLQPSQTLLTQVSLKDGRVLDLQTEVQQRRPKLVLLRKTIQAGPAPSAVRLGNQELLPQDGRLSFFLKTEVPDRFPRSEKIEVATADESFQILLSVEDGNLVLQDTQSVLAILDPLKNFGPSAFGPLQFRPVSDDGRKGDWQPLATLVRLPSLKEVRCPDSPDKPCELSGSNLFLIGAVASDAQFANALPVPPGFTEATLTVPRPNGTLLYLKLRDDPKTVNTAVLPVLPER
jgi:hypothetical protein